MGMSIGAKLLRSASAALELPKELALNLPVITAIGAEELLIENYKNLLEYGSETVRVRTVSGILLICGRGLKLAYITKERLSVSGRITAIEYTN